MQIEPLRQVYNLLAHTATLGSTLSTASEWILSFVSSLTGKIFPTDILHSEAPESNLG